LQTIIVLPIARQQNISELENAGLTEKKDLYISFGTDMNFNPLETRKNEFENHKNSNRYIILNATDYGKFANVSFVLYLQVRMTNAAMILFFVFKHLHIVAII